MKLGCVAVVGQKTRFYRYSLCLGQNASNLQAVFYAFMLKECSFSQMHVLVLNEAVI